MSHRFWFKSMVAGYKVVRHDLLIALHLALDLVRDCCVLGMLLRDRAEHTDHHREGGVGNQIVDLLKTTQQPYTASGILDMIEQSSILFDQLASEWSEAYQAHRYPLLNWLHHIRETVVSGPDQNS